MFPFLQVITLPDGTTITGFLNPPAGIDLSTLGGAISSILPFLITIAGMVAFLYLILGGFKYLTARDDPKAVDAARGTIVTALLGLLVVLLSFFIIRILEDRFHLGSLTLAKSVYAVDIGTRFGPAAYFPNVATLFTRFMNIFFITAGLAFFFITMWGGIKYLTSRGDEKATAGARATITNGLVGLLIILFSYVIIKVVFAIFGVGPGLAIF